MSQITTSLDRVLHALNAGKTAAIPTETVYGLAALITHEKALAQVFALKKRPTNHPLIMHVHPDWDLTPWVESIPEYAQTLMQIFWPGPLTFILKAKSDLHPLITGGQPTVAVRSPKHPLALELLEKLQVPFVAPSANPFGKISPTTAEHVQTAFAETDLLVLDGGRCSVGIESTIISATHPDYYQIERPGHVCETDIKKYINIPCNKTATDIRAPGKMAQHYQPQKPLYYFENEADLKRFCQAESEAVFVYTLPNNAEAAAFELYFELRKADKSDAHCIAMILPPDNAAWAGVRERIIKAGRRW